jgi:putative FmdB family regulatory protein
MPIYEYCCEICDREFEEYKSITERNEVFCCGKRATKLIGNINTHKDRAYNFTTEMFNGKLIEVRSKGHYNRLLKQHGIIDASQKEAFQHARHCKIRNENDRRIETKKRAKKLVNKMKKENVNHVAKEAITKLLKSGRR